MASPDLRGCGHPLGPRDWRQVDWGIEMIEPKFRAASVRVGALWTTELKQRPTRPGWRRCPSPDVLLKRRLGRRARVRCVRRPHVLCVDLARLSHLRAAICHLCELDAAAVVVVRVARRAERSLDRPDVADVESRGAEWVPRQLAEPLALLTAGGRVDAAFRMEGRPGKPEALDDLDVRRCFHIEDLSLRVVRDPYVAPGKVLLDW